MNKKLVLPIIIFLLPLSAAASDSSEAVNSAGDSRLMQALWNQEPSENIQAMLASITDPVRRAGLVNMPNYAGYTPLMYAAYSDSYHDLIPLFIRTGANPLALCAEGNTCLTKWLKIYRSPLALERIRVLFSSINDPALRAALANQADASGRTPLELVRCRASFDLATEENDAQTIIAVLLAAGAIPTLPATTGGASAQAPPLDTQRSPATQQTSAAQPMRTISPPTRGSRSATTFDNPLAQTSTGDTILTALIKNTTVSNRTELIRNLLASILDEGTRHTLVNTPARGGITPLILAACAPNSQVILSLLLEAGADPLLAVNEHADTCLTLIIRSHNLSNRVHSIQTLLASIPKELRLTLVNTPNRGGATPLILAARMRGGEILVPLLLEAGANPLTTDAEGNTWLLHALRNISGSARGETIVVMVESITNPDIKRTLVNHRNNSDESPILSALFHSSQLEEAKIIIPCLIKAGANPLAINRNGHTYPTAIILRAAEQRAVAAAGDSILHTRGIIIWLLESIPDETTKRTLLNTPIQALDRTYTPLSFALKHYDGYEVPYELLEAGADPFADGKDGELTLKDALNTKDFDIVEIILKKMIGQFKNEPIMTKSAGLAHIKRLIKKSFSVLTTLRDEFEDDDAFTMIDYKLKTNLESIRKALANRGWHLYKEHLRRGRIIPPGVHWQPMPEEVPDCFISRETPDPQTAEDA